MAKQRKLSPERTAFINNLIEHYQPEDTQDVQAMLKDLLGGTLQGTLEAEMDVKLCYSKYNYKDKNTNDSRNGFTHDRPYSTQCIRTTFVNTRNGYETFCLAFKGNRSCTNQRTGT